MAGLARLLLAAGWVAWRAWGKEEKERLNPEWVLRSKSGKAAEVRVWHNVVVSCKGQVFKDCEVPENNCDTRLPWTDRSKALVGCGTSQCMDWDGCGFGGGSCDPKIEWSHVTREAAYVCEDGDIQQPCNPAERRPAGPKDVVVVLTQPQWGAYYHFVIDALSRVMWVQDQFPKVFKDPKTFFHTGMIDEVGQAWAQLVGIRTAAGRTESRLLEGYWKAKVAYFPPSNACANNKRGAQPFAIQAMRKAVSGHPAVSEPLPEARTRTAVLVRRAKSQSRSVQNHAEVLAEMKHTLRGWTVRIFSDAPQLPGVHESCRMFYTADMVVGPHGAGFANLVCSRKGVPLVEFQQKFHSWDYELLSMKLGMPYFGIPTNMEHYGPGLVNIPQLREALQGALAAAEAGNPEKRTTPAPAPAPAPSPKPTMAPPPKPTPALPTKRPPAKLKPKPPPKRAKPANAAAEVAAAGWEAPAAPGPAPGSAGAGPAAAGPDAVPAVLPLAVTMSTIGVGLPPVRSAVSFMMGCLISSGLMFVCGRLGCCCGGRGKVQDSTVRHQRGGPSARVVGAGRQAADHDEPKEEDGLLYS